jgi:hypothetical protein
VLDEEFELEEGDDRWGQGVSGERGGGRRTISEKTPGWAMGRILAWARFGPATFYFFLFFPFSFFLCLFFSFLL